VCHNSTLLLALSLIPFLVSICSLEAHILRSVESLRLATAEFQPSVSRRKPLNWVLFIRNSFCGFFALPWHYRGGPIFSHHCQVSSLSHHTSGPPFSFLLLARVSMLPVPEIPMVLRTPFSLFFSPSWSLFFGGCLCPESGFPASLL